MNAVNNNTNGYQYAAIGLGVCILTVAAIAVAHFGFGKLAALPKFHYFWSGSLAKSLTIGVPVIVIGIEIFLIVCAVKAHASIKEQPQAPLDQSVADSARKRTVPSQESHDEKKAYVALATEVGSQPPSPLAYTSPASVAALSELPPHPSLAPLPPQPEADEQPPPQPVYVSPASAAALWELLPHPSLTPLPPPPLATLGPSLNEEKRPAEEEKDGVAPVIARANAALQAAVAEGLALARAQAPEPVDPQQQRKDEFNHDQFMILYRSNMSIFTDCLFTDHELSRLVDKRDGKTQYLAVQDAIRAYQKKGGDVDNFIWRCDWDFFILLHDTGVLFSLWQLRQICLALAGRDAYNRLEKLRFLATIGYQPDFIVFARAKREKLRNHSDELSDFLFDYFPDMAQEQGLEPSRNRRS